MKSKKAASKKPLFSDNPKVEAFAQKAFTEMFRLVGLRFTKSFITKDGWFRKKSWSCDTEKRYRAWFIAEYRKAFRTSTFRAEREFAWFNLAYGWSLAD